MAKSNTQVVRDVWLSNDRWPDAKDLGRWARDIFRLEHARTGQDKALALWKWLHICMTRSAPAPREGPQELEGYLMDTLKYLTVYGGHYCDGLSKLMVNAWQAAEAGEARKVVVFRLGHVLAELRYKDADGKARWHVFDPQHGWYAWSRDGGHIAGIQEVRDDPDLLLNPADPPRPFIFAQASLAKWADREFSIAHWCVGDAPAPMHNMKLNLRAGEKLTWTCAPGAEWWPNTNADKTKTIAPIWADSDTRGPGAADLYKDYVLPYLYPLPANAWAGTEEGTAARCRRPGWAELAYSVPVRTGAFAAGATRVANVAGEKRPSEASAVVHPQRVNEMATLVYEVTSPYLITEASIEGVVRTGSSQVDYFGALISLDNGSSWTQVFGNEFAQETPCPGPRPMRADLGDQARRKGQFNVFGRYQYMVRIDMLARNGVGEVGLDELTLRTRCLCNMFALPLLQPGVNTLSVRAGAAPAGAKLRLNYRWDECGVPRALTKLLPAKGGRTTIRVRAKSPADVRVRGMTLEALI